MKVSLDPDGFDALLRQVLPAADDLAPFKRELEQILVAGREFGIGVTVTLLFAHHREQFLTRWPQARPHLAHLELLIRVMERTDFREALSRIRALSGHQGSDVVVENGLALTESP